MPRHTRNIGEKGERFIAADDDARMFLHRLSLHLFRRGRPLCVHQSQERGGTKEKLPNDRGKDRFNCTQNSASKLVHTYHTQHERIKTKE